MQSALQDTFVYYTARGERQAWSIHGDTAIQTYENGAVFSYTITKWHPHRGALTLTLDTTAQKETLFVALNGSLFDQLSFVGKHSLPPPTEVRGASLFPSRISLLRRINPLSRVSLLK